MVYGEMYEKYGPKSQFMGGTRAPGQLEIDNIQRP